MKRPRGRPRKEHTQTPEERAAYLREYNQRPEVIARRREYNRARYRRLRAEESAEERRERLDYESARRARYNASKRPRR